MRINYNRHMLSIVIQAGGDSRRMGRDKGLLPFLGQPLIQRLASRLLPLADELLVTTNKPQEYRFLGLPLYTDLYPGKGALGGLYTALSVASHPYVGVIACDMPFVSIKLLKAQMDIVSSERLDAVIPRTEHGLEPFHAIYLRATCLPQVEKVLEANHSRVDAWFPQAAIRILTPQETAIYDPQGVAFLNINTPEELRQAEIIAHQMLDQQE